MIRSLTIELEAEDLFQSAGPLIVIGVEARSRPLPSAGQGATLAGTGLFRRSPRVLRSGEPNMTRLRYPFAEIGLRCRLCNEVTYVDTSGGRVGARLTEWRRRHARHCPEWGRWAAAKGLRLDPNGAVLYPGEAGPYRPRDRGEDATGESKEPGVMDLPAEAFVQNGLI